MENTVSIHTTDLILSLIKNDLINTRLVTGLDRLGLDAGDHLLGLGTVVLRLMGFTEGPLTDAVYDRYYSLTRRAAGADVSQSFALFDVLAKEIYNDLQTLLPNPA